MVHVAIIYHSGYGHTERLAKAVATGAQEAGAKASLFLATELTTTESPHWEAIQTADAIIFGAPTYMGAASAEFKKFADTSSHVWANHGWKDKLAAGFTNSGSIAGDKSSTLNQMFILASQHGMIWVPPAFKPGFSNTKQKYETAINRTGFFTGVGTQSLDDHSPEQSPNAADLETGQLLGKRVALVARQWIGEGKLAEAAA
jgi:NAD(P)H dehydrogenase (quinone)